ISKEGIPTISYYGIDAGICLAQSIDDDLITWTKLSDNPVIREPREGDPGWGVYNVFDPHIWLDGETYYAILGGNVKPHELRDTAYVFKSEDLHHWTYLHPFYTPRPEWTDPVEDCACPDFFKLGNRYVLSCISHAYGARYYLGQYQDGLFMPEEHHRMNWAGGSCFAPESLVDNQQRRVFWAWVLDQRKGEWIIKNELGVMTLPRILSLDSQGQLLIKPPEELESLRSNLRQLDSFMIKPGVELSLTDIMGDCMELIVQASVPDGGLFGLKVRMSPDGGEQTVISVDTAAHSLSVNTTHTSLRTDIYQPYPLMRGDARKDVRIQTAPFTLESGALLELRVFLDRSILEVFANDRQCMTQRVYPTQPDSLAITLFSLCGDTKVELLQAWDISATNSLPAETGV
ncbi:MAG: hypothetical protein E4H27_07945, partial [Anaerolineales bacterium]